MLEATKAMSFNEKDIFFEKRASIEKYKMWKIWNDYKITSEKRDLKPTLHIIRELYTQNYAVIPLYKNDYGFCALPLCTHSAPTEL